MKSSLRCAAAGAAASAAIALGAFGAPGGAAQSGAAALEKFSNAWSAVKTYKCTLTAHEVSGSRVQDRVYHLFFSKPSDTRMDIVGGDGRGGAAVWRGGDTVRGHQGGLLAGIKLNLNLHARLATSLRGTTVAEANFGAILEHIKGLKTKSLEAESTGDATQIVAIAAEPSTNQNVTKELVVLGKDGLPTTYEQYEGDTQVKKVMYTELQLNVELPASTWSL